MGRMSRGFAGCANTTEKRKLYSFRFLPPERPYAVRWPPPGIVPTAQFSETAEMAKFNPRSEPQRNGRSGQTAVQAVAAPDEVWGDEESLRQEVRRLTAENQQLMGLMAAGAGDSGELERLRAENAKLRTSVTELEQLLSSAGGGGQDWNDQLREYESLL